MNVFGWTLIRWPQAGSHESRHQAVMDEIRQHASLLEEAATAITASIAVQSNDLARINALRLTAWPRQSPR